MRCSSQLVSITCRHLKGRNENVEKFKRNPISLAIGTAIVASTLITAGCGTSSSSSGTPNYTINTSGGTGGNDGASGGNGNYVDLYVEGGTSGVVVSNKGKANASFTSLIGNSRYSNPDLGDVPLTISADTTMVSYARVTDYGDGVVLATGTLYVGTDHVLRQVDAGNLTDYVADLVTDGSYYISDATGNNDLLMATGDDTTADSAPAGTVYLETTNSSISVSDGDTSTTDTQATGLVVNKGVTLTVPQNNNSSTTAYIWVDNSIVNKGTITSTDDSTSDRSNLDLGAANYYGAPGSSIDTSGYDDVRNAGYIDLDFWTSFVSSSDLNSSGVTDSTGDAGSADSIHIYSGYATENNGNILAMGADGGVGSSGSDGDSVDIESYYGVIHNSGAINTSGGNGTSGGSAGQIYLYGNNGYSNPLRNSGDLTANGGDSLAAASSGGSGGWIGLYNYAADLISSGDISNHGGDATVAGSSGGDGGDIDIEAETGSIAWGWGSEESPAGNIIISGNIDSSGGSALATSSDDGGNGGFLDIRTNNDDDVVGDEGIQLLGYASITTRGGDGNYAGDGDTIDMDSYYGWDNRLYMYLQGSVLNEADLTTSGGDAPATSTADNLTSSSAQGGDVWLATGDTYGYAPGDTTVTNLGNIDTSGGSTFNKTSTNSDSGAIDMFGYAGVTNRGNLNTSGATDIATDGGTDGYGGLASYVELYAEGPVVSMGDITSNGGDGEYRGARGYGTWMFGSTMTVSGVISANGGNADATLAGSVGGDGNDTYIIPVEAKGSSITATFSYAGGTGTTAGDDSYAVVAGACQGNC
jgi:hypothetical protein